jgi:hypothetical protein
MTLFFSLGGVIPVFSQEILATFGIGGQFMDYEPEQYDDTVVKGMTWDINVLFVGESGFTISTGTDMISDFTTGLNIDPVFGLGYVYYNKTYRGENYYKFYVGGIYNIIPKTYMYDGFMAATLVGGYDFGWFLLGGQLTYMHGVMTPVNGFKFSINVGVNAGTIFR